MPTPVGEGVTLLGFQAEVSMTENNGTPEISSPDRALLEKSKVNESQTLISQARLDTLIKNRRIAECFRT